MILYSSTRIPATQLIDSAYVQLRQDFAYASLTGVPASSAAR